MNKQRGENAIKICLVAVLVVGLLVVLLPQPALAYVGTDFDTHSAG